MTTARPTVDSIHRARTARPSTVGTLLGSALIVVLAVMPFVAYADVTDQLVTLFVLLIIASMWNLLAGFAGLVSVGQQAYIGIGAYGTLAFSLAGVQPWLAILLGAAVCAAVSLPTSLLAFRLRGDYFAVGTWVIAEVYRLLIIRVPGLGGPSGTSLTQLSAIDPALRGAITYWVAFALALATVGACFLLLRGRIGLALTAVRDNESAAGSLGVDVVRAKRIVYLVAAAGAGSAGGLLLVQALSVQPDAIFSVQWSAYMIFIVVLGGTGRIEGPIVGAVIFFALQNLLSDYGAWYLVVLGAVSVAAAIWLPEGIWGLVARRTGFRFFPIGFEVTGVRLEGVGRRRRAKAG
ncbi:branched-chain amino acid ABC transporter permease [uncultured Amnibacterium sp.]|uniref:branched-chain amino acid ABC transporter permease n=1 Tax=uncultured Amnibacterium sp. TaxID=1631851 RepID=UPI0035CB8FE2